MKGFVFGGGMMGCMGWIIGKWQVRYLVIVECGGRGGGAEGWIDGVRWVAG